MSDDHLDPFVLYFNARVHGMRADLFTRHQVEEFLAQQDLSKMSDALLDSPYRRELAEALTRYSAADAIEEAVSRNLVSTFQSLIARANGDFKSLVELFLMRWDLAAVKSLLRCRHHGQQGDDAAATLVPGPTLPLARMRELAQFESMEALVNGLIGWNPDACRCLRRILPEYRENRDLGLMEDALDRAYFVANAKRLRVSEDDNERELGEALAAEIDRINLRTLYHHFEARGSREALDARLLSGGLLPISTVRAMAAAPDMAGAVELLGGTRYSRLVDEFFQLLQTKRFSPVERFFERLLMKQIRSRARRNVFGISLLADYVWMKYNETINLRLIARGLAGQLPAGRVREELFFA